MNCLKSKLVQISDIHCNNHIQSTQNYLSILIAQWSTYQIAWVQISAVIIEISKDKYTCNLLFNHGSVYAKSNEMLMQ